MRQYPEHHRARHPVQRRRRQQGGLAGPGGVRPQPGPGRRVRRQPVLGASAPPTASRRLGKSGKIRVVAFDAPTSDRRRPQVRPDRPRRSPSIRPRSAITASWPPTPHLTGQSVADRDRHRLHDHDQGQYRRPERRRSSSTPTDRRRGALPRSSGRPDRRQPAATSRRDARTRAPPGAGSSSPPPGPGCSWPCCSSSSRPGPGRAYGATFLLNPYNLQSIALFGGAAAAARRWARPSSSSPAASTSRSASSWASPRSSWRASCRPSRRPSPALAARRWACVAAVLVAIVPGLINGR